MASDDREASCVTEVPVTPTLCSPSHVGAVSMHLTAFPLGPFSGYNTRRCPVAGLKAEDTLEDRTSKRSSSNKNNKGIARKGVRHETYYHQFQIAV